MSFQPIDESGLLDVFRKEVAKEYVVGLETENDGFGFDIVYVFAAQQARVAEAFALSSQAYYLRPHSTQVRPESQGELHAVLTAPLRRTGNVDFPALLAGGLECQLLVRDGLGHLISQERYRLASDVDFVAGDAGPIVASFEDTRAGYQGNFPWPGTEGREFEFVLRGRSSVVGATIGAANDITDVPGVADRFSAVMIGQFVRIVTGPNAGAFPRRITAIAPATNSGQSTTIFVDGPTLVAGIGDVEVEEFADVGFVVGAPSPATKGRHGWLDAIGNERNIIRQPFEADEPYRQRIVELPDVVSPAAILRLLNRVLGAAGIPFDLREAGEAYTVNGFRWVPANTGSGWLSTTVVNDNLALERRRFYVIVGLTGEGELGTPYDSPELNNAFDYDALFDGFPVGWVAALNALLNQLNQVRGGGIAPIIVIDPTL